MEFVNRLLFALKSVLRIVLVPLARVTHSGYTVKIWAVSHKLPGNNPKVVIIVASQNPDRGGKTSRSLYFGLLGIGSKNSPLKHQAYMLCRTRIEMYTIRAAHLSKPESSSYQECRLDGWRNSSYLVILKK
ncbi:C-type lectin domain family 4 member A [Manis javanica]|nr:C-type lectin domain family 4 member A [Manis javanica]